MAAIPEATLQADLLENPAAWTSWATMWCVLGPVRTRVSAEILSAMAAGELPGFAGKVASLADDHHEGGRVLH